MVGQLIESTRRRERFGRGLAASVVLHVAGVAALLGAASEMRGGPTPGDPGEVVIYHPPQLPPLTEPTTSSGVGSTTASGTEREGPPPFPQVPNDIPTGITISEPQVPGPDIDLPRFLRDRGGRSGGTATLIGGETRVHVERAERLPSVLREPHPNYPAILRDRGIAGTVLAEFVIDTAGAVDTRSIRILASDQILFEQEVRRALVRAHYRPAQIAGRNVAVIVQQRFAFTLAR